MWCALIVTGYGHQVNPLLPSFCLPLPEMGVLHASGADAAEFLHKQLTNDIVSLSPGTHTLAGYCNPQGRLFAIFHVLCGPDGFWLVTPRALIPNLLKRLRMFVLRAKVVLTDASGDVAVWGSHGDHDVFHAALAQAVVPSVRRLTLLPSAAPAPLEVLPTLPAPADAWRLGDILARQAQIYAPNSEAFVPQMVDLEEMGGLSFSKGCYPGQEIVARAHYLGRVKRKLFQLRGKGLPPLPGSALLVAAPTETSAGRVVDAQAVAHNEYLALASLQTDLAQPDSAFIVEGDATQVALHLVNSVKNA
jgi:tRNA-modifying protein YgfZ